MEGIAVLLTGLAAVITAGALAYTRIMTEQRKNRVTLQEVHVLVNSQRDRLEQYIAMLTAVLVDKGIEVPAVPGRVHSTPPSAEQLDI